MAHNTDTDRDLPTTLPNDELTSKMFDLRPGDRVLWGDRKVPCVVARIVEADDPEGQAFTASVIPHNPQAADPASDLRRGDVFLNTSWGTLTGRRFVLIQGPRGGFYALANLDNHGRTRPAFFRCVRASHSTKSGFSGQGNFSWEGWFSDDLRVVESGDAPEVLDEKGDLPKFDEIRENRVVGYDRDDEEHFRVGTVEEVLEEGVAAAYDRAHAERESDEKEVDTVDDLPAPEDVSRSAEPRNGIISDAAIVVREFAMTEYGLKAVLEGPAPWDTPEGLKPMNEVLKALPWDETHRAWDPEREAWTVDASEVSGVASELASHGYPVVDEADREDAPVGGDDDTDDEDDADHAGDDERDETGETDASDDADADPTEKVCEVCGTPVLFEGEGWYLCPEADDCPMGETSTRSPPTRAEFENANDADDRDEEATHELREVDREPVVMGGDVVDGVDEVAYNCPVPGCEVPVSRHERAGQFDSPPDHPETVEIVPTPESAELIDALTHADEDGDADPDVRTDGGTDESEDGDLASLSDTELAHELGRIRGELACRGRENEGPSGFLYSQLADRLDDVVLRYESVIMAKTGEASLEDMLSMVEEVGRQADHLDDDETRTDGGEVTDECVHPFLRNEYMENARGEVTVGLFCPNCKNYYSLFADLRGGDESVTVSVENRRDARTDGRGGATDESVREAVEDGDADLRTDGGEVTDEETGHEPVSATLARCPCGRLYHVGVNPKRCPACGDARETADTYLGP